MMTRRLPFILLLLLLSLSVGAQSNKGKTRTAKTTTTAKAKTKATASKQTQQKPVKSMAQLKKDKDANKRRLAESRRKTEQLNKSIKVGLDSVQILDRKMMVNKTEIDSLKGQINELNGKILEYQDELEKLQTDLDDKKQKYAKSVVYLRRHRSVQNKLMFIFSASNFSQLMRRFRYLREYSTFQKAQGKIIIERQKAVTEKTEALKEAKDLLAQQTRTVMEKQDALENMKSNCQTQLDFLNKNLRQVQNQITQYQEEAKKIDSQIDYLVQQEIIAAKKKAEEERRRKEAAERRRREEEKRKAEAAAKAAEAKLLAAKKEREAAIALKKAAATKSDRKEASKAVEKAESAVKEAEKAHSRETKKVKEAEKASSVRWYEANDEDRTLSSGFASNKGRLPMPITGSYAIVGHYGRYNVAGLSGVTLENKGINIKGQAGASARAVFDGVVSSIYQYGPSYIIMVRHGSYISVYSGLSAVSVSKGMKVKTRQTLGRIGADASGNYILQFQLTNESVRLNPEQWVR